MVNYNKQKFHKTVNLGFSLFETIVALIILSTTMVAIFGALRASANASHHSRMQTQAVLLAETLMTETKLSEPTSYKSDDGHNERFTWKIQVSPTGVEGLGSVNILVAWKEQQREQVFELNSFVQMKTFNQSGQ